MKFYDEKKPSGERLIKTPIALQDRKSDPFVGSQPKRKVAIQGSVGSGTHK